MLRWFPRQFAIWHLFATIAILALATEDSATAESRVLELEVGAAGRKLQQIRLTTDTVVDTRTGRSISPQELRTRLSDSRIVLVAEEHTSLGHHNVQLQVLQLLIEAQRPTAIGLEMFPDTAQQALDDWSANTLSEAQFLDASDWYGSWGYNWNYYREIFLVARRYAIPMIALNTSREAIAAVRRDGLATARERFGEQLPPAITPPTNDFRTLIESFFETDDPVHGALPESAMDALIEAQGTWDAVMANHAANALSTYPTRTLVVLAGTGHVAYGLGILRQLQQWNQEPSITIVPTEVDGPEVVVQASIADFLWGIPAAANPAYPDLGAITTKRDEGLTIIHVEPDSPAASAKLREGDVLLQLQNQAITDKRTLNEAIATLAWGDELIATVRRGEEEIQLSTILQR